MTVCFTGHRKIEPEQMLLLPQKLDGIMESLIARGAKAFCAGGALGFDTLAALKVLEKKRKYPHLSLCLILPCRDQAKSWSERNQEIYRYILAQADEVHYVSECYTSSCMRKRNRALVERSKICIAYCTEEQGGSAFTLQYAKQMGLEIINLA